MNEAEPQADDWEVKARNLEIKVCNLDAQLADALDDLDDMELDLIEAHYAHWVFRAEGLVLGFIAGLLLLLL